MVAHRKGRSGEPPYQRVGGGYPSRSGPDPSRQTVSDYPRLGCAGIPALTCGVVTDKKKLSGNKQLRVKGWRVFIILGRSYEGFIRAGLFLFGHAILSRVRGDAGTPQGVSGAK